MSKRLLMISTDRKIFEKESAVRARQIEYAKQFEEVHIVVFADKQFSEQVVSENCWVYSTRSATKFAYPFNAMRLGRFIIEKRGITHITCQDASLTAMAGIALKKEFGIPLEIQIHEDIGSPKYGYSLKNRIRKSLALSHIPKADSVRVVSNRIKSFLVETLKIDQTKIEIRPIRVETEMIAGSPVLEGADLHKKYPQFKKIVLMASRLEKEKNIQLALAAWSKVVRTNSDAGLVIIGLGSKKDELSSLVTKYNIEASVVLETWADQSTLISYYKTADVFLNTSLFEGYGMTLLEAHAAGCTVVSTDVGVAQEIGAHVVGFDAEEIAQKISELL